MVITNLPNPLTSFVGREKELRELKELLGKARLLTLTGAGGSGKTRLAIQVARDLLEKYKDGVSWVELGGVQDESLVPQVVAKALGATETPNQSVTETLTNYLRAKQLLLVMDNCEHLIGACARLAETLLSACSGLRILATSREALSILGENVFQVPTLAMPETSTAAQDLMHYESVCLFIERAQAVKSDFGLTAQNASAIAEVCRRLDGIPLALELAAVRVKLLKVENIAARLDDRFNLLTTGNRTALPRQQTLRAMIDWSYDLLPEPARKLFRRLSVFAGGFTLDAAEQVCADEQLTAHQVLDELSRLVDRSLVIVETRVEDAPYRMLETIREYAREKLVESGEVARVQDRHLDFFVKLAEEARARMEGAEYIVWLNRLEVEHDNLRAALAWSFERNAIEKELALAVALGLFWQRRGYLSEGRMWLDRVLTANGIAADLAAKALNVAAQVFLSSGDSARATSLAKRSLTLNREIGNNHGIAGALRSLGRIARDAGDLQRAGEWLEESLAQYRKIGDKYDIAVTLLWLAGTRMSQGDNDGATMLATECLALFRELENRWGIAFALGIMGDTMRRQGNYRQAILFQREALIHHWELGDKIDIPYELEALGLIAAAHSQFERATRMWGVAAALRDATSAPLPPSYQSDYAPYLSDVRARMGESAFASAWDEGYAMPLEQAIAYALETAIDEPHTLRQSAKERYDGLSARERQVATLIARGKTNREIAVELVVGERTVESHVSNVLARLGFTSRSQIAAWATEKGLTKSK